MDSRKAEFIKPNLLRNRNFVATINHVWVADFTFVKTHIQGEPNSKIKLLIIYDLGNGEIVGAKVFKFNKTKKKQKENRGISSLYVTNFFKKILYQYKVNLQKKDLIIHTDRGTEFLSLNYNSLENLFPVKLSMTDGYQPTQNAVAERLNKTFKNQLKYIKPLIPDQTPTIKKLQTIINLRAKNYNQKFKNKRNLHLGADALRKLFNQSTEPLPDNTITYQPQKNGFDNSDADSIQKFRTKIQQSFGFEKKEAQNLNQRIEKLLAELQQQQQKIEFNQHVLALLQEKKHEQLLEYLKSIEKKVTRKKKIKHKTLPLREPINNQIFYLLIKVPKGYRKRHVSFCRFRVVTALLYFTGLRVSEVSNLTEKQVIELKNNFKTQHFSPKQNKIIYIVVAKQISNVLENLQSELNTTFYDSYKIYKKRIIKNTDDTNAFVTWYNKQLRYYLLKLNNIVPSQQLIKNIDTLSSHSFRINRITSLLTHNLPIEQVQKIIGHANVSTTAAYFRWKPDSQKTIQQISEIEQQMPNLHFEDL